MGLLMKESLWRARELLMGEVLGEKELRGMLIGLVMINQRLDFFLLEKKAKRESEREDCQM